MTIITQLTADGPLLLFFTYLLFISFFLTSFRFHYFSGVIPLALVPCEVFWGVGEERARWSTRWGGPAGGDQHGRGRTGRGRARAGKDRARWGHERRRTRRGGEHGRRKTGRESEEGPGEVGSTGEERPGGRAKKDQARWGARAKKDRAGRNSTCVFCTRFTLVCLNAIKPPDRPWQTHNSVFFFKFFHGARVTSIPKQVSTSLVSLFHNTHTRLASRHESGDTLCNKTSFL